jgi:hypothetical protein
MIRKLYRITNLINKPPSREKKKVQVIFLILKNSMSIKKHPLKDLSL